MSQKLPLVGNFNWVEQTSEFNKDFTKRLYDESDEGQY